MDNDNLEDGIEGIDWSSYDAAALSRLLHSI